MIVGLNAVTTVRNNTPRSILRLYQLILEYLSFFFAQIGLLGLFFL